MSNLGVQTMYDIFNGFDDVVCERAFLPEKELLKEYEKSGEKLLSIESQTPIDEFDVIAFSMSFEDDFFNIPKIFEMAGIPLYRDDRSENHPLIISGGAAISLNPEPIADFFDLFTIGEGESLAGPLIAKLRNKIDQNLHKEFFLEDIAHLDGFYAPGLYDMVYENEKLIEIVPKKAHHKSVKRSYEMDIEGYELPVTTVYTKDTEFSSVALIEIERGCGRACRFCPAGFIYLPPRFRGFEKVKEAVIRGIEATGKVGLVGAAVSEYPQIKELLKVIIEHKGKATLSSLRMEPLDEEFLMLLKEVGYKTITIAPEGGSEKLRKLVNKEITTEEIYNKVRLINDAGFNKLKMYIMIGLPGETSEDILETADFVNEVRKIIQGGMVSLSVNPFVPKAFSPFQWHPFMDEKMIKSNFELLKKNITDKRGVDIKFTSIKEATMQSVLARADRRASSLIVMGAKDGWRRALKTVDLESTIYREREAHEVLPWDVIDLGIEKDYLYTDYQRSFNLYINPECNVGPCHKCGVC